MKSTSTRLECIDRLRGIVLILMVLDHIRDFMCPGMPSPETVPNVGPALFLTRFVTHFCAPVFFLLAGMSAFYYRKQKASQLSLVRFLITRGLWLIFLELTVVHVGWFFTAPFSGSILLQVIWALGWSMIVLGALSWLPTPAILVLSVLTICLHHLIPIPQGFFSVSEWGWDWVLAFLHGRLAPVSWPGTQWPGSLALIIYPLVPWVGVMGLGFGLAPYLVDPDTRARRCFIAGGILCGLFVLLRFYNMGLDPNPFRKGWIDFLNTTKYPPSLPFLAMTLGPALLALGALDSIGFGRARWLLVYGRVPLLFYIAHLYLAHIVGVLWFRVDTGEWVLNLIPPLRFALRPAALPWVYAAWISIVALLYWPCLWFMRLREKHRDWWWLSYL